MLVLIETDVIEDEKLGLGPEERRVGYTGVVQVHLGLLRNPARIPLIMLTRDRIDDAARHDQRTSLRKRIDVGGIRIRNEQHIALVNRCPAANTRSVDAEPIFEGILLELGNGIRNVLRNTRQVRESQIELASFFLLGKLQHFFGTHQHSLDSCPESSP